MSDKPRLPHPYSGVSILDLAKIDCFSIGFTEDNSGGQAKWWRLAEDFEAVQALENIAFGFESDSVYPDRMDLDYTRTHRSWDRYYLTINVKTQSISPLNIPNINPDFPFMWEKIYRKRIQNFIQVLETDKVNKDGSPDIENAVLDAMYVRCAGDKPAGLWSEVKESAIIEEFNFDYYKYDILHICNVKKNSDELQRKD